jgi:acetyltransferase-like isoleucine patch superfamily enzyme
MVFGALPFAWWGPIYARATGATGHPGAFRRTRVGAGSYIDPTVQIVGWNHVRIGRNSTLSERSWLNVNHRDEPVDRITIGDSCHIGRNNFLSAGPSIVLHDYCFTGLDCHFLGCGHNIDSPSSPYLTAGLSPGAPIIVGHNCWLATSVTVFQGVAIGRGSVIGARAVVTDSIPPYSVAFGTPCRVVKRFDFRNNRWVAVGDWTQDMERSMPNEQEYIDQLRRLFGDLSPSLIAGSRRFGWL